MTPALVIRMGLGHVRVCDEQAAFFRMLRRFHDERLDVLIVVFIREDVVHHAITFRDGAGLALRVAIGQQGLVVRMDAQQGDEGAVEQGGHVGVGLSGSIAPQQDAKSVPAFRLHGDVVLKPGIAGEAQLDPLERILLPRAVVGIAARDFQYEGGSLFAGQRFPVPCENGIFIPYGGEYGFLLNGEPEAVRVAILR